MNGEPKATTKSRLIETYLARKKMASSILVTGPTNTNPLWELKPIFKPSYSVSVQPTHLLKGIKSPNLSSGKNDSISFCRLATGRQTSVELTGELDITNPKTN